MELKEGQLIWVQGRFKGLAAYNEQGAVEVEIQEAGQQFPRVMRVKTENIAVPSERRTITIEELAVKVAEITVPKNQGIA